MSAYLFIMVYDIFSCLQSNSFKMHNALHSFNVLRL